MDNPDLVWFTDGSYLKGPTGTVKAGYAVVSLTETVKAAHIPSASHVWATAKLSALTSACSPTEGKAANIYTGSRYAFRATHDFDMLWKQRGFLTSSGQEIQTIPFVIDLLELFKSLHPGP